MTYAPYYKLGPARFAPLSAGDGVLMRVNDDVRKSVVFFGVPSPAGISYGGTGFMMCDFEDGVLIPFLVTARHVAKELEKFSDTGFFVRANTKDGSAQEMEASLPNGWAYHPDPTVDLAAVNFSLSGAIYDIIYYPLRDQWFKDKDRIAKYGTFDATGVSAETLCGDPVAIVGLFRLHSGKQRNVPIVHSGTVAALPNPNEPVPVRDRTTGKVVESEVYLVEAQTLDGLSGSPVFTKQSIEMRIGNKIDGQWPNSYGAMVLLGLYTGSWDGEPGAILAQDRSYSGNVRVPVGMGTVVPAYRIVELVRGDEHLNRFRKARVEAVKAAKQPATQDSAFPSPPSNDANPTHREDFTRLLGAAARKPPQED